MKNRRLILILSAVVLLLLVPLIAMQFTEGVNWSFFDFTIAAVLLFGTAFGLEVIFRKVKTPKMRVIISLLLITLLLLVWAELAVGVFGSPFAGS